MELERYEQMRQIAERNFDVFAGYSLERYFLWKFTEEAAYTKMGAWWNRKGEEEIDLVCEDELNGRIDFFEVKHDRMRYERDGLVEKVSAFFHKYPKKREMNHALGVLSLAEM